MSDTLAAVGTLTPPLDPAGPIPYGRQQVDEDDLAAMAAVLRSNWLTTGPAVAEFEADLCRATGARFASAVTSGTAALHAAYAAAGLGPGDVCVTTPLTFAATANVAVALGAEVRFVDVDAGTGLMDPAALEAVIEADGDRIRVITPVDFTGAPADYARISGMARRVGATVVADAAHSLGATRDGVPVGQLADLTCLSFHPVKIITTGEGGAVLTSDEPMAGLAARFRTHGITRDPALMTAPDTGGWHYEMIELGLNYRLPDLLAALGHSQMAKLDRFVARRRQIAAAYDEGLADVPGIERPDVPDGVESAWHLYVIRVAGAAERRAMYDALHEAGILVQVHYEAVHLHPWWRARGHGEGECPRAERYAASCLSLPIFPAMTDEMLDRCIDTVRQCAARVLS